MRLDRVSVALRPRTAWEAIDLGFAMARAHAGALWGGWTATVLPVHALVWLLIGRWPGLALGLLWYLKPLFDRVPLLVLSRALFGDPPDARALWAELRRGLGPHVARSLTWSRPSPLRAVQLPIWQLEGLPSGGLARRERVLTRGADSGALGLLMAAGLMELCLTSAGVGLVLALAPEGIGVDPRTLAAEFLAGRAPRWFTVASALSWTAATSLVEPLYVAGGFALYINRRTWLEGWDIELQLRRLAARLGAAALLLLGLLGGGGVARALDTGEPPAVEAAELEPWEPAPVGEPLDPAPVRAALEAVLALPEMPHEETRQTWGLRGEDDEPSLFPAFAGLGPLGAIIGTLLKALVIVGAIVGLGLLLRALLRARPSAVEAEASHVDPQERLPALLRGSEPPPLDPVAAARALWREGRRTEALGVLYRGALLVLVSGRGFAIPDGATESDCSRVLRGRLRAGEDAYFEALTRSWQRAAYAHRPPEEAEGARLLDEWARWFGGAP